MRTWFTGNLLIAIGLTWLIVDRVLRTLYPLSWGGPNIGGGFILLLALAAILAGMALFAVAGIDRLRAHRASTPPSGQARDLTTPERPALEPWPGRGQRRTASAVNGVLVAGWVAALIVLPGDSGQAGINGVIGVSVNASGSPVLVLEVCRGSVDTITILGPNRGDEPNEVFAQLRSPEPVTTRTTVDILRPPDGWSGAPASLPLQAAPQMLLIATAEGRQSTLGQVNFTAADLATLDPGTVQRTIYSLEARDWISRRAPIASFPGPACDKLLNSND